MPTLRWNKQVWDGEYDWENYDEEWSKPWGSSESQWFSAIYPRIHSFIPCNTIIEISPGFGRWTKFLLNYCKYYKGIDLSQQCINECKKIFSTKYKYSEFYLNNGISLKDIYCASSDFIFSYDSLIHVDLYIIEKYISQILLNDILSTRGVAFIHHSNLKYSLENKFTSIGHNTHNRDINTDFKTVYEIINKYHGITLIQELINLGNCPLIDCYTLFCRNDSLYNSFNYKVMINSYSSLETYLSRAIYNNYAINL